MKKETIFRLSMMPILIGAAVYFVAYVKDNEFHNYVKSPVNVEYYKVGDIVGPDYALCDTMVVVDAIGLNKDMALIEQGFIDATDGAIDSTFHLYCSVK